MSFNFNNENSAFDIGLYHFDNRIALGTLRPFNVNRDKYASFVSS